MGCGQPGLNVVMHPVNSLCAVVALDEDHVKGSAVIWMKFKMLNVILNAVVIIIHGLIGHHARLLAVLVIKNVQLLIVMVYQYKLTVNVVPMLLSLLNGLNGVPVVLNVEMVS